MDRLGKNAFVQKADSTHERNALDACGRATVFDVCAAAFLNEPCERIVRDAAVVARTLGAPLGDAEPLSPEGGPHGGLGSDLEDSLECCGATYLEELRACFGEMLFVAVSPRFVPLQESCLVGCGADESGKMRYGSVQSSRSDHVQRCYKAAGFDMARVPACDVVRGTLRCDSLGCELAFLAFLAQGEAQAWQAGQESQALHWRRLSQEFVREHAGVWFKTAAERMAAVGATFYAQVCSLAVRTCEVVERVPSARP